MDEKTQKELFYSDWQDDFHEYAEHAKATIPYFFKNPDEIYYSLIYILIENVKLNRDVDFYKNMVERLETDLLFDLWPYEKSKTKPILTVINNDKIK